MYKLGVLFCGLISCIIVRYCYFIVDFLFASRNSYYDNLMIHRKLYVQKNIVKSVYLMGLFTIASVKVIGPIILENRWETNTIHLFAVLYGSNDLVGLVCVEKLPTTTKIHHCVSTILVFCSLTLDFQHSDIGQSMLVYTYASAAAYIVNLHLGVRLLSIQSRYQWLRDSLLRLFAAVVYVSVCVCSWTWQLWWISTRDLFSWYHVIYIAFMLCIVRDDLILIRWLVGI